jgi:hypothetical protein
MEDLPAPYIYGAGRFLCIKAHFMKLRRSLAISQGAFRCDAEKKTEDAVLINPCSLHFCGMHDFKVVSMQIESI